MTEVMVMLVKMVVVAGDTMAEEMAMIKMETLKVLGKIKERLQSKWREGGGNQGSSGSGGGRADTGVDGHLDCFQFLAIMSYAAMNIHVQVFVQTFFNSFDITIFYHYCLCHY